MPAQCPAVSINTAPMSVTVTHQGRRAKIALGSAHVAVREVVARAKAHFGLEGSFGLRTTRGRRAEVPDAAAWAHTGLSNNCELELVRRAGGGGGAVRVAAAVSHMGSAPRTVSFAVDAGTSLAAVVERLVAEGAAPPDPLRRAPTVGSCEIGSRARTSGGRSGISATAAARPCASRGTGVADGAAPPSGARRAAPAAAAAAAARPIVASYRAVTSRSAAAARCAAAAVRAAVRALAAAPRPASRRRRWGGGGGSGGPRLCCGPPQVRGGGARQPSLPRVRAIRAGNAAFAGRVAPAAASRCSPLSDSTRNGAAAASARAVRRRCARRRTLTRALDMLRPLAAPGLSAGLRPVRDASA